MKTGYKTSEFWLSLAAIFFPTVAPIIGLAQQAADAAGPITATVTGALVAAAYNIGRSWVKAKHGVDVPALPPSVVKGRA